MDAQASLAQRAQGRVISMNFFVRLTPPQSGLLGETDEAMEIGQGLIREAARLLKAAGEAEGFEVEISAGAMVY